MWKNFVVRVPDFDKGRLVPRNVLAVIMSVNKSGLYQLCTKEGALQLLFIQIEFELADSDRDWRRSVFFRVLSFGITYHCWIQTGIHTVIANGSV